MKENLINDHIPLSGRFLIRLAKEEFTSFKLVRECPKNHEILRFSSKDYKWADISLMIYESGKWIVNGFASSHFEFAFNYFINSYLAHLIQKVPSPEVKAQILNLFTQKTFTSLPSLILTIEILTSAAIKYPDKYPYIYKLISSKYLHRLNQNNSPYIFLSILYGNEELSKAITDSLTSDFSQYYFKRSDCNPTLEYLLNAYISKEESPKIKDQVLSLKLPPYQEEEIPF